MIKSEETVSGVFRTVVTDVGRSKGLWEGVTSNVPVLKLDSRLKRVHLIRFQNLYEHEIYIFVYTNIRLKCFFLKNTV